MKKEPNKLDSFYIAKSDYYHSMGIIKRLRRWISRRLYDWGLEVKEVSSLKSEREKAQPRGHEMNARKWAATCIDSLGDCFK